MDTLQFGFRLRQRSCTAAVALLWLLVASGLCLPSEISAGELPGLADRTSRFALQAELQRLIDQNRGTRELLEFLERLYDAGQLDELPSSQLPWTTWSMPGWRWETIRPNGERIVLATDGLVLVAIRQARTIEFSIIDRSPESARASIRGFGNGAREEHVSASSVTNLAAKAPRLFPVFYYFAGPTAEIVSGRLLPQPAVSMSP